MVGKSIVSRERARMGEAARMFSDFMASDDADKFVPVVTIEYLNGACFELQESAQERSSGYAQLHREAQACIARIKRRRPLAMADAPPMANGHVHHKKRKKKKHNPQGQH